MAVVDLGNIDVGTVLASLGGSGAIAYLGARFLAGKAIDHALALRLADHQADLAMVAANAKAALDADADAAKTRLEAAMKLQVEDQLGASAAERSYAFEARKRLYAAVGPLRFQLIAAAVQYRARVLSIAQFPYSTRISDYFGRSVLYRLMRVLTLTELVERQIAYADFSVDTSTLKLLRFREAAMRALSGADVVLDHPKANWNDEVEHIFRDTVPALTSAMITSTPPGERVLRVDEFKARLAGPAAVGFLDPLAGMIDRFDRDRTPLLWLRLIALSEVCGGLIEGDPIASALEREPIDPAVLLRATHDAHIVDRFAAYLAMLADFRASTAG